MDRSLLMTDQDVTNAVLLENLVVERKDSAPRIAKDDVDALVCQGLQNYSRTCHVSVCHDPIPIPYFDSHYNGCWLVPNMSLDRFSSIARRG
jgi:hypothetical protein